MDETVAAEEAPATAREAPAAAEEAPPGERAFAFTDPNGGRYLASQSAIPLGRGRGYVSQKEIAFTFVGYGATDWLCLEVASAVHSWFGRTSIVGVAVTAGVPLGPGLHVSGSIQGFGGRSWGDPVGAAFALGSVTWGDADGNVTLRLGAPFTPIRRGPAGGAVIAAEKRLGDHQAVVTETWIVADPNRASLETGVHVFPSGAVRFLWPRVSVDLGFVPVIFGRGVVSVIPVPWIDVTWNFAGPP